MKELEYLSKVGLKSRKWTEGAISKFLGEPDKLGRNPYYRKAPEVKLYLISRVEQIESNEEFVEWLNKSKPKREKQSKIQFEIAEKKRKDIQEYIAGIEINIPLFDKGNLLKLAVDHYNELWSDREKEKRASLSDDKEFLYRIAVNMLRHAFSDYEEELSIIFGQVGVNEAYVMLKNKVLGAIGETYPFLAGECNKQKV